MNIDLSEEEIKKLRSLKYSKREIIMAFGFIILVFLLSEYLSEYKFSKVLDALKITSLAGFMALMIRIRVGKMLGSVFDKTA